MKTYKFRAECQDDCEQLFMLLQGAPNNRAHPDIKTPKCARRGELLRVLIEPHLMDGRFCGDTTVEMDLDTLTLEDLRELMRQIVDSHVMLQTVQPITLYTGERDNQIE
jgi:hypothetical protein